MLALAAARLGYKCHIYCPEANGPAAQVSAFETVAEYDDETALAKFASEVDVVTYEFENIPAAGARFIADKALLRPGVKALEITQDRLSEKNFLNESGVETAPYMAFQSEDDLDVAFKEIGRPSVAKTRRFGYDGKGQVMIKSRADKDSVLDVTKNTPAILEGFVHFDREISVVVARSASSDVAAFPVGENVHTNHILDTTVVPANIRAIVEAKAKVIAAQVANALEYVGVLAVEMFVKDDTGDVIVNEIAPRVHNSGHWTIEGAKTSQFEQHIRAICDLPLGSPEAVGKVTMKNLLGKDILEVDKYLEDDHAHYHHYGKQEPRDGRKMGHVTWVDAGEVGG
jgi:5-(carboxyamino)imidazole ribonucleotide synthase